MFGIRATVDGGPAPRVYGLFDMSIFVNIVGNEATPFLAEVRPEHEGKTFELDIFDMGDNDGNSLDRDTRTGWNRHRLLWVVGQRESAPIGSCHIDISDRAFQRRLAQPDDPLGRLHMRHHPDPLGCWWKIKIHNEGQAHDRTTWTARITGNPLRLVP